MATISVPLSKEHTEALEALVKTTGANRASVMRKALEKFAEDEAVAAVLRAQKEPTLKGGLRQLAKKIR